MSIEQYRQAEMPRRSRLAKFAPDLITDIVLFRTEDGGRYSPLHGDLTSYYGSSALFAVCDEDGPVVVSADLASHAVGMTDIFPLPDCRVEQITAEALDLLRITARGVRPGSCCPDCGRASRAVHGRYRRKPADLPSLGRRVAVSLRVRRFFYCRNVKCARRTFAERLPELVAPHARRTRRLATAQARIGVALGGNVGSTVNAQPNDKPLSD